MAVAGGLIDEPLAGHVVRRITSRALSQSLDQLSESPT